MTRHSPIEQRIVCDECGGSGKRRLISDELECPDCEGLGSWEDEPESCRVCGTVLEEGVCSVCDAHLGDAVPARAASLRPQPAAPFSRSGIAIARKGAR